MKTKSSVDILYNEHITSVHDDRTLEEWAKHEGRCISGQTVAEVAKIFAISLCCYAFDISFSISTYQIENTNNCITLLKEVWSLGAQEDRTALYVVGNRIEWIEYLPTGTRVTTIFSNLLAELSDKKS